ncbi:MAG: hypothetical protein WA081_11280 [Desulfosalsimonadaceae bacterium]
MSVIKKFNTRKKFNIGLKLGVMQNTLLAKLEDPKTAKRLGLGLLAFGAFVLTASQVSAFTAPAAGSFAYTVYDVAVAKILQGAIGFVGGVGAMVMGAVLAIQQKVMAAIPAILGGAILLNADTLVTTLGLTF